MNPMFGHCTVKLPFWCYWASSEVVALDSEKADRCECFQLKERVEEDE
jgi:hypothetical protein